MGDIDRTIDAMPDFSLFKLADIRYASILTGRYRIDSFGELRNEEERNMDFATDDIRRKSI